MDDPHTEGPHRGVSGSVHCLICLSTFSGQLVATPQQCEHQYCLTCITEWVKMTNSCPVDRLEFSVLYQRTYVGGGIQKMVKVGLPQGGALKQDELSVCDECGRSDRRHLMLLCPDCDSRYHIGCLSPPLSAVPVEDWFCEECSAGSRQTNEGPSRKDTEIDEAEVMDLLAEAVPASSRLRASTTRQPTLRRRSERVHHKRSRRHAIPSHPLQHVPRYLLKSTWPASEEHETNNLLLNSPKTDSQVTLKRKRRQKTDR